MGLAIDTVGYFSTQAAASAFPTALGLAPGDPAQVRSFKDTGRAVCQALIYSAGGGQKVRVSSPMLHDNVTGLTFAPGEVPSAFLLPPERGIELTTNDTLSVFGAIAAAGTIVAGLVNYYTDVRGSAADLRSWADIAGDIMYIKAVEVDLLAVAVGAWTDTLITNTENQLHADYDYAVLGYDVNPAVDIVGVKGEATGNLRACGPGPVSTLDITEYYVYMANRTKRPCIPVFNANDRNAFYVSAFNHAAIAGGAASVYLIVAQLRSKR